MSKLLVIDTETSGLDPQIHSILSLGAVVWEDGAILADLELLIAEEDIIADPDSLKVNRIDLTEHKRIGLPPTVAMNRFQEFLGRCIRDPSSNEKVQLVGHNVHFDIGFLQRLFRLASSSYEAVFSHRVLDTAAILRFLILAKRLPLSGAGSTEAFDYFHIEVDPLKRHSALADAKATAMLLNKLIEVVSVP